jgi:hypothetical protein
MTSNRCDAGEPVIEEETTRDAGAAYAYRVVLDDDIESGAMPTYIKTTTPGVDDAFGSALERSG